MKIKVLTEDFRNATKYTDTDSYPLAVAIKRQLGVKEVMVSMGVVFVKYPTSTIKYSLTHDWYSRQEVYGGKYTGVEIDDMIYFAKDCPDVEFPELELELELE